MAKEKTKKAIKPETTARPGKFVISKASMLDRPRSIQLYGLPGSGKSSLAASAVAIPGVNKGLLIDFDYGSSGIAADYPDLDVVTFSQGDIATFEKFWRDLLKDDGRDYDVVIIDSGTKAQSWKKKATVIKGSSDVRGQWGEVGEWTIELVENLQAMRPLGIITFHTEIGNSLKGADGDTEYLRYLPSLQGAAKMNVGASACIIGHCETEEMDEDDEDYDPDNPLRFTVRVQPSDTTITKNRFRLPPVIDTSGGLPRIYEMIDSRSKKKGK